jgi:hypothetical protein
MSAVSLFFFSVRVAILADSLAIAFADLDTTAFFAGALAAAFTAGFATALVAFAAGFAALGAAAFFAVAILRIFHFFNDQSILAGPIFS